MGENEYLQPSWWLENVLYVNQRHRLEMVRKKWYLWYTWCFLYRCLIEFNAIGSLNINNLNGLSPVSLSLIDKAYADNYEETDALAYLTKTCLDWPRKLFELEKCSNSRYVVLSRDITRRGIYLLDRDANLYKICENFNQYIRLAIAHLAIIDWQTWFSSPGPVPETVVMPFLTPIYSSNMLHCIHQNEYS